MPKTSRPKAVKMAVVTSTGASSSNFTTRPRARAELDRLSIIFLHGSRNARSGKSGSRPASCARRPAAPAASRSKAPTRSTPPRRRARAPRSRAGGRVCRASLTPPLRRGLQLAEHALLVDPRRRGRSAEAGLVLLAEPVVAGEADGQLLLGELPERDGRRVGAVAELFAHLDAVGGDDAELRGAGVAARVEGDDRHLALREVREEGREVDEGLALGLQDRPPAQA